MAGYTITGTHNTTIILNNPIVQNPATVAATGTVSVNSGPGVHGMAGFAWTLTNLGAITETGTLGDGPGVLLDAGGLVTNFGIIQSTNHGAVVVKNAAGTAINSGTITSHDDGVYLQSGGVITNGGSGLISVGGDGHAV